MQLEIIRWIQSFAHPVLDVLMELATMAGEQMLLAAVFCGIYWCFDKRAGKVLLYSICCSAGLNGIVKDLVRAPRPIGEPGIVSHRVHTATGHSFPSGHTQNGAAFWMTLGLRAKRRCWAVAAFLLTALIGLSRMYLGVHYPADVLGGMLLGGLCAWGINRLMDSGKERVLLLLCVPLSVGLLLTADSPDSYKSLGLLLGSVAGLRYEQAFVQFETGNAALRTLVLRYLLGLASLGVVYGIPKLLLPSGAVFYVLRYTLVGFYGAGLWPAAFTKMNR